MKKYGFLFAITLFTSCDLVDSDQSDGFTNDLNVLFPDSPVSSPPSNPIQSSNWRVQLFVEEGLDLTKNFEGISFSFSDGGALEAQKNGNKIGGRWRLDRDYPSDELYIDFPKGTVLEELDEDWYVVERLENRIVLEDSYDGYVDRLVFVRGQENSTIPSQFVEKKAAADSLFEKLENSTLEVQRLLEDFRDKSELFQGSALVLSPLGKIELRRSSQVLASGIWHVGFNEKDIVVEFDFPDAGISEYLDEEWLVVSKTEQLIQLSEFDDFQEDRLDLLVK